MLFHPIFFSWLDGNEGEVIFFTQGGKIIERTNLVRVTYLNALLSPFFLIGLFSICLLLSWMCCDQINFT